MLTKKQAWEFIAGEFRKSEATPFNTHGLCLAIAQLRVHNRILEHVACEMETRVTNYQDDLGIGVYIWPTREDNHCHSESWTSCFSLNRAALAEQFAAECETPTTT